MFLLLQLRVSAGQSGWSVSLIDHFHWVEAVALGGPVVIMLAIGPKFTGSNPAENDGFLRTIKIRSTSFGGEVKPSAPRRILVFVFQRHQRFSNW
jgi:hypothetical protein